MWRVLILSLILGSCLLPFSGCAAFREGLAGSTQTNDQVTGPTTSEAGADTVTSRLSGGRVETCGGGAVRLNAKEKKVFELHNEVRRERGLRPFCVQPDLMEAARAHSREMIRKDYFSHDSYSGTSLVERLRRHGYTTEGYRSWQVAGNIAWGNHSRGTPGHVFGGWMNSESHRPNILSEEFRQVGVGTYTGKYKSYRDATAYTVEFGVRRR